MILELVGSVLLVFVLATGLAWPLAQRLSGSAATCLLTSAMLSQLLAFALGWGVYVAQLPLRTFYVWPALTVLSLAVSVRSLVAAWRDSEFRELLLGQLLVTAWSVGWLTLVLSYSGGNWVGDWFGHWQRAMFFLDRLDPHLLFNGFDPLPSRPPLVNILAGACMVLTQPDFAHYQLALTVLGSLVFLPAAILLRRFGPASAVRVLVVLFMVSPLFVQNVTYAWTKLPAAFFTLAALHAFLATHAASTPPGAARREAILFACSLGGAILAHYSAGPYALVFAAGWLGFGWLRRGETAWWRQTAWAASTGFAWLTLWFGWALHTYGARGTFLSNSSVTDKAPSAGDQLVNVLLNVRDTLVPHFLRDVEPRWIEQTSAWGWWRDWFFNLYQTNYFFAFGSTAWLVLAVVLLRIWPRVSLRRRLAWTAALVALSFLGIAVHGSRGDWGLAHICLQPLILLGLVRLAASWSTLSRPWRLVLITGATLDVCLGIFLQFGVQSFLLDTWLNPGATAAQTFASYSPATVVNLNAKQVFRFTFVGDRLSNQVAVSLFFLATVALLALVRAARPALPSRS